MFNCCIYIKAILNLVSSTLSFKFTKSVRIKICRNPPTRHPMMLYSGELIQFISHVTTIVLYNKLFHNLISSPSQNQSVFLFCVLSSCIHFRFKRKRWLLLLLCLYILAENFVFLQNTQIPENRLHIILPQIWKFLPNCSNKFFSTLVQNAGSSSIASICSHISQG